MNSYFAQRICLKIVLNPPRKVIQKHGVRRISFAGVQQSTVLDNNRGVKAQGYLSARFERENSSESKKKIELKKEVTSTTNLHSYYTAPVTSVNHHTTNRYVVLRSHNCGELTAKDIGVKVSLAGWVQFKRMGGKFLVLRDGYGTMQVIIPDNVIQEDWNLDKLPLESVIAIKGTVALRPQGQANPNMRTGEVEVIAEGFSLLNAAKNQLPFSIREFSKAKESLRMKYRYLDLRFPEMQSRLRLRSSMLATMRHFLHETCGFVEVETPTLFKRTPGGAQEFVVPSRLPGKCYTLVQSPQQFKQLLMVGGIDRYFQVARCYRDETSRPDRQPEFTQVDIEMSFSDQCGVMSLSEQLISQCWRATVQPDLSTEPFPVMTYNDALNKYGTDKPDTRFNMIIQHVTETLRPLAHTLSPTLRSALLAEDGVCAAVIVPQGQNVWVSQASISRQLTEQRQLLTPSVASSVWLRGIRVPTHPSDTWPDMGEGSQLAEILKAELRPRTSSGDVIWLAAGPRDETLTALGRLRILSADEIEKTTEHRVRAIGPNFLWLVDFPLFVPKDEPGTLSPAHHPFTHPHPEDAHMLFTDPLKVRGQHYDLVLDGWEIGGGSVRIHNSETQRRVLQELLGVNPHSLQHMLDALDSGCPPHAGIAFGLDRLVAVACGAPSIRDVIAFPKAIGGRDPMSGAPVEMSLADQQLYHVKCPPVHHH